MLSIEKWKATPEDGFFSEFWKSSALSGDCLPLETFAQQVIFVACNADSYRSLVRVLNGNDPHPAPCTCTPTKPLKP